MLPNSCPGSLPTERFCPVPTTQVVVVPSARTTVLLVPSGRRRVSVGRPVSASVPRIGVAPSIWSNDRFSSISTNTCWTRSSSFELWDRHGRNTIHNRTRRMKVKTTDMTSLQIVFHTQDRARQTHFKIQFQATQTMLETHVHAVQTTWETQTTALQAQLHGHQSQHLL